MALGFQICNERHLVLVRGFTLPIANVIQPQDHTSSRADLDLGIIADEHKRSSPVADEVFQSTRKIGFPRDGIASNKETRNANKDLHKSAAGMKQEPDIRGWNIRNEQIGRISL